MSSFGWRAARTVAWTLLAGLVNYSFNLEAARDLCACVTRRMRYLLCRCYTVLLQGAVSVCTLEYNVFTGTLSAKTDVVNTLSREMKKKTVSAADGMVSLRKQHLKGR